MSKITFETLEYNGKRFTVPVFPKGDGFAVDAHKIPIRETSPIVRRMNSVWTLDGFKEPTPPVQLAPLSIPEVLFFTGSRDIPEVLDMPIKFPGSEYRVPRSYNVAHPVIQRIADYEASVNPQVDDYYCYLTFRHSLVRKGKAHHPAPVHVDGFQGARWNPKVRINHTYTMASGVAVDTTPKGALVGLPTTYFVQPFDFSGLDEAMHDFFWEMNYQVAQTNGVHAWTGTPNAPELMDAYCPHFGSVADVDQYRFWIRLSFEERIFDRLGNGHNPLFDYKWDMVVRDIEQLHLTAYHADCDPSLRHFPWQALDGSRNPKGVQTLPNLRPRG